MTRVDLPEARSKEPVIVPRHEYEADKRRGYTVLEYSPAGEMVIRNPRNQAAMLSRPVPAVLMFRCMRCQYDVIDDHYTPDPSTGTERRGLDLMKTHLFRNEHPWPYSPFDTPYGNIEDVKIEGVEDYTKEI